jgi:hypothetical protein
MDGLETLINGFEEVKIRNKPVVIEDHYLALIYEDDKYFKIFKDIEELPAGFEKSKVRPVSWTDLYYYSVYWQSKEPTSFVTRYPIAGPGSIYACNIYLRTTTEGLTREELTEDWQPSGKVWYEIPNRNATFFDSMNVHPSKIIGLTADYDGDKTSLNMVYSDNAKQAGKKFLASKEPFMDPNGGLNYGLNNHVAALVLHNFTGE